MGTLKFRVLLDSERKQEVFRDILIDENADFETLYHCILNSFAFEGNDMGSFYISNDEWDKGHEIALMDLRYSEDDEEGLSIMNQSIIKNSIEFPDQKIILVYDFLRMWIFLIELIERTEELTPLPLVTLSVGMAPPEDSRMIQEDDFMQGGSDEYGEDDDFDEEDDDFEDGYDDEDLSQYQEY